MTALLSYVSLNMRGVRKILKKLAKHVPPSSPMPGYIALEIDHPHEPEKRILSVQSTFNSYSVVDWSGWDVTQLTPRRGRR